jgi:predicted phage terminase large subunit-like protein
VAYSEQLSHDFARRMLQLVQSEWYQARWPLEILRGARASVSDFWNSKGGRRFSTMMGGEATGVHAHILVVDDPHKPDDLQLGGESAKAALDKAWQRWTDTFSTRRADASTFARICIMQRLHQEDIAGKMVREDGTVHLCLPMEFSITRAYRSKWGDDWRTAEGELLCPKRFPEPVIASEKLRMTARSYAAQHQQMPSPENGTLFMREWFLSRWTTIPNGMKWILSVDASLKDNVDSDFACLQVWAYKGAEFYLIDQICARMAFSDTVNAIKSMKRKWPMIGQILVEDKANGPAIVDVLKRSVPGVIAVNPEGGKIARAHAVEPFLRAMNCTFPPEHNKYVEELIEQATLFPVGSNDDMVDAMTQALLWMSGKHRYSQFRKAMANVRGGQLRMHRR